MSSIVEVQRLLQLACIFAVYQPACKKYNMPIYSTYSQVAKSILEMSDCADFGQNQTKSLI